MEEIIEEKDAETPLPAGSSTRRPVLNNFLEWLASLVHPSEEERENAGIYLGGEGRK